MHKVSPYLSQVSMIMLHHKCNKGATNSFDFQPVLSSQKRDYHGNDTIFINVTTTLGDQNFGSHYRPCYNEVHCNDGRLHIKAKL